MARTQWSKRRWARSAVARSSLVCLLTIGMVTVIPMAPGAADGNEAPGAPSAFRLLTAGYDHSCAVLADGAVKCWGGNGSGQLGVGDTSTRGDGADEMADNLPAVSLGAHRTATAITAGDRHTCARLDNGTVKCWGYNYDGQLGLGDRDDRGDGPGEMGGALPPLELGTGRSVTALAAGTRHTCALLDNGTVKCWGYNDYGQLGLGHTWNRGGLPGEMGDALPAVDLGAGRTATALTGGGNHSCALLDNGTVKCWGRNLAGQLGLGDTANRGDGPGEMGDALSAVALGTGRTATALTGGGSHSCALLDNGTVKCWGYNDTGQLGLGDRNARGAHPNEMGDSLPAVSLGTGRSATAITAGNNHTCARLDNGTVKCWGYNETGQLGVGDTANRGDGANEMGDHLPVVDLGTGRTVTAVTAGIAHTCARLDNAALRCWGYNDSGRLGVGDTQHRGDGSGEMGDHLPAVDLGVPGPRVTIVVSAYPTVVFTGDAIDYQVSVTNTGTVVLTGVEVTDPNAAGCEAPVGDLGPSDRHVLTCAHTTDVSDEGIYTNIATVDTAETDPVASNAVDVTVDPEENRPPPMFRAQWGTLGRGNSQFNEPEGVAIDSEGYVYVVDEGNNRIQKFTPTGTFVAKWGSAGSAGGQFDQPLGVAVDAAGYVYVADYGNARVQRFTSSGEFVSSLGTAPGPGLLHNPNGVAVDSDGNVYVTDPNHGVVKYDAAGTFATGWGGSEGAGWLNYPGGIAVDSEDNVYVSDSSDRVMKYTTTGVYLTSWGGRGSTVGRFFGPSGLAIDEADNVYVVDRGNNRIQEFTSSGTFVTRWGTTGQGNGQFNGPAGIAVDPSGTLAYVVEAGNNRIQKFRYPVVDLRVPADNTYYARGQRLVADYACRDKAGGSGIASCTATLPDGALIDTATLGTYQFSVTAVDDAGNRTPVTHTYTVVRPRPDGTISRGPLPPYLGYHVYNTTGAGQTATGSAARGASVVYWVNTGNESRFIDRFRLTGTASTSNYQVRYRLDDGTDITSQVMGGTYITPPVELHYGNWIKVVVTVRNTAPPGSSLRGLLTIISRGDPSRRDAVGFVTSRR